MAFTVEAIGRVESSRSAPEDDRWDSERCAVILDPSRFGEEALAGLADFSHAEVIFLFDKVGDDRIETGARRPRGREDWPLVGIFAQRGKNRPNRIGVTACRILSIQGTRVEVAGLDAIDGTPVLDIKPAMREFLPRGTLRQPDWASELMRDYW